MIGKAAFNIEIPDQINKIRIELTKIHHIEIDQVPGIFPVLGGHPVVAELYISDRPRVFGTSLKVIAQGKNGFGKVVPENAGDLAGP